MATISVSGQAEFTAALKAAQAGDRLVLADGSYGTLTMTADFTKPITIASANPLGASFAKISLNGATNVHFDGLKMTAGFAATLGSKEISITNSTIDKALYLADVRGIMVEGNTINGDRHAVMLNSVSDFQIRNNLIRNAQEDLLRITGDSAGGLIENNRLLDAIGIAGQHPDAIQMFSVNGITPRDIVIRGNHIWDDSTTGATSMQGIFLSDPGPGGYRNILIENNLIAVPSGNSIYINGGQENVVVRGNILIPNKGDGGAIIRLAEKSGMDNSGATVTGNVMKLLRDETRSSTIGENLIYGRNADLTSLFSGSGQNPGDFLPPNGQPVMTIPEVFPADTLPTDITWIGTTPAGALPAAGAVVATLTSIDVALSDEFTYAIGGLASGFVVNAATGVMTRTAAMPQNFSTTLVLSSTDTTGATLSESFFIAAGNTAADTLTGHATRDSVLYGFDGNDRLTGGAGDDNLFGQNGNDTLSGGVGNDTLVGGAGTDAILGGDGYDMIRHTLGDGGGTIDGGAGTDTLQVLGTTAANSLTATLGTSGRIATLDGNTLTGIEKITADLGSGTDTLSYVLPTGVSLNLTVNLLAGTATGFTSVTGIENVFGNIGNDRLTGNAAANNLQGAAGNDTLSGGAGNDTLVGGGGTDAIFGGDGNDTILHAAGDGGGTIDGGVGTDTLVLAGTTAAETLTVAWNGTTLTGFAVAGQNNTLTGVETITVNLGSGSARDTLAYTATSAAVTADLSTGQASGLAAISGIENLVGGNRNDRLTGNASNNDLSGGAGDDILSGNAGNDWLTGGIGSDTMWGGTGSDLFIFISTEELGLGAGRRDVIMDFGSGDRLDVSGIDANTLFAGDQAFTFLAARNAAFTANGQIRWSHVDTDANGVTDATLVQINLGGTLAADHELLLMNTTLTLLPGHFML